MSSLKSIAPLSKMHYSEKLGSSSSINILVIEPQCYFFKAGFLKSLINGRYGLKLSYIFLILWVTIYMCYIILKVVFSNLNNSVQAS